MNAPILDDEMRQALETWDGIWFPPTGLLRIWQHTAVQLLDAGSKGVLALTNTNAEFLEIVAHQKRAPSSAQQSYLDGLTAQYNAACGEVCQ